MATTTSTSSMSTSSTSSSISSTSSSVSTTSYSLSTSSTSTSLSSTSSSISSTSSSTSSTSISSTSSSTSISSTSSSISSTSTSSTSTSSTSSSTSVSSTSTSISSTSSSVSSTSASISSTSFSSTSSSSSTSTTTLPPPYIDYSFADNLTLPTTNAELNSFNAYQYSNVSADDGDYFIQSGSKNIIQQFKKTWTNNTDSINIFWTGRSTDAFSTTPILLQIYNVNSAAWETVASETVLPADVDMVLKGSQTANVSNYYDSTNTVSWRIYQQVN